MNRLLNDVDDEMRRREQWRVVDPMGVDRRARA